jgi:cytochrome c biogenesis protein CcmG/thiol:disulfide interchange protein DsbE
MRRVLWILAAAGLVAVLAIGLTQAGGNDPVPKTEGPGAAGLERAQRELEGAPAPLARLHDSAGEIRASDVKGYEAQLRELRGYPVVVNAWASWCGPCKLEFPFFRDASTRLGKKVAFLGLNVSDNREDAARFLGRQPVPYPHLEDGDARIVQKAGAAGGLPTTIFYDADGKRAYIHQGGYRSAADLQRDIERYAGA